MNLQQVYVLLYSPHQSLHKPFEGLSFFRNVSNQESIDNGETGVGIHLLPCPISLHCDRMPMQYRWTYCCLLHLWALDDKRQKDSLDIWDFMLYHKTSIDHNKLCWFSPQIQSSLICEPWPMALFSFRHHTMFLLLNNQQSADWKSQTMQHHATSSIICDSGAGFPAEKPTTCRKNSSVKCLLAILNDVVRYCRKLWSY